MNTDLTTHTFNGLAVRTILDPNGAPMFCGRDVAQVLGYKDQTNALKQHCRGVVFHHPISDRLGRTQEVRFIPESDVYRLIHRSKLSAGEAARVTRFVRQICAC